jgi:hypothetical protein
MRFATSTGPRQNNAANGTDERVQTAGETMSLVRMAEGEGFELSVWFLVTHLQQ